MSLHEEPRSVRCVKCRGYFISTEGTRSVGVCGGCRPLTPKERRHNRAINFVFSVAGIGAVAGGVFGFFTEESMWGTLGRSMGLSPVPFAVFWGVVACPIMGGLAGFFFGFLAHAVYALIRGRDPFE